MVGLVLGGGAAVVATPRGANLTCLCDFYGEVTYDCPDGNATLKHICDGLYGTVEMWCPSEEDRCASWNATSKQWNADCSTYIESSGAARCECAVARSGVPKDVSTTSQKVDMASIYFGVLASPPDPSRALVMILALAALLFGCIVGDLYGRRLARLDAEAGEASGEVGNPGNLGGAAVAGGA